MMSGESHFVRRCGAIIASSIAGIAIGVAATWCCTSQSTYQSAKLSIAWIGDDHAAEPVTGLILDGNGNPLAGVDLTAETDSGNVESVSNSAGKFSLTVDGPIYCLTVGHVEKVVFSAWRDEKILNGTTIVIRIRPKQAM